ncbi:MAG: SGNH/GDSL hydrolase family protein [Bacteroidetes bacterium]|nr:MAG: SGNH/GDSL hydrolase family protein [Bacteroidota bacterium]
MTYPIPDQWFLSGAWPSGLQALQTRESIIVVCYGDSITYGFDCETGMQVTQPYPSRLSQRLQEWAGGPHIHLANAGHNGWTSEDGKLGLESQVLSRQPDIVLLMFGLNDAYQDLPLEVFRHNLTDMTTRILDTGALLLLMPPTPVAYMPGVEVPEYAAIVRNVASLHEGVAFFDLHAAVQDLLSHGQAEVDDLLPDGVHFSPEGYPLLGDLVFSAWQRMGE